jgi:hypothetical protein
MIKMIVGWTMIFVIMVWTMILLEIIACLTA